MEKSDHDLLIRLDEKIDMILEKLKKCEDNDKDHSKRINELEGFKGQIIGFAAALSFVISTIISKFSQIFGGN